MLKKIATNHHIHLLFATHAREIITLLHSQNLHFMVACDTDLICFEPKLTQELKNKLGGVSVFVLSGYSFKSLEISENFFSFEAGLILNEGQDIGTLLKIPYSGVVQILAPNENSPVPIFINPFEAEQTNKLNDSLNAILSRNMDLLKGEK